MLLLTLGVILSHEDCPQSAGLRLQPGHLPLQLDILLLEKSRTNRNLVFLSSSCVSASFCCKIVLPSPLPVLVVLRVTWGLKKKAAHSVVTGACTVAPRVRRVPSCGGFLLGKLLQHVLPESCIVAKRVRVDLDQLSFFLYRGFLLLLRAAEKPAACLLLLSCLCSSH